MIVLFFLPLAMSVGQVCCCACLSYLGILAPVCVFCICVFLSFVYLLFVYLCVVVLLWASVLLCLVAICGQAGPSSLELGGSLR